jgi:Na+:H+ antiporter, NhaA family
MSSRVSPDDIPPATPPEAWQALLRFARLLARPLDRFLRIEAASGILLLVAAATALLWANSAWAESYVRLWHTPLGIRIGAFNFERTFDWVVNDVLMVIFFFVVGMEIRREVHDGELSEWRRAALPAIAAGASFDAASWSIATAVFVGLFVGKPLGVLLASALALQLRIALLPAGLQRRQLLVLGVVAGIGFTMALFIAQLAFSDSTQLAAAKLGVLVASGAAAAVGLALGRLLLAPAATAGIARSADEAESSTLA